MPRPIIELDQFRDESERRISLRHTQSQIRGWLAGQGCQISKNTLSSRVTAWEAGQRSRTPDSDSALLAAIESEYYDTHHDVRAIAAAIIARGIHTTPN